MVLNRTADVDADMSPVISCKGDAFNVSRRVSLLQNIYIYEQFYQCILVEAAILIKRSELSITSKTEKSLLKD